MIHSSYYQPRIFPILGDTVSAEIDRAQSIDPTVALNREEVNEIGRDGRVGSIKKSPTIGYRLTQYEYGSIEFWQKMVNSDILGNSGQTEIKVSDFKTPYFNLCAYLTDDDGTFKGTLLYPKLRTSGFSFTISEPQAIMERSFDFVGESAKTLKGANKYYIDKKVEIATGELITANAFEINLGATGEPEPAEDPDNSGVYMFLVVRVRSGATTELVRTTDYSYSSGTKILTVNACQVGDVIKAYYSSATAPATIFSLNDSDASALIGDSASIYLYVPGTGSPSSSDYIYRLQSVTLDVAFDREDNREIGNKEVIQRGISNTTVTVTLGRILEDFTVEEVLRGEDKDIIDVEELSDQVVLIVKIFSDNAKGTFKYGFKATGLTPNEFRHGASVNEYVTKDATLEGESLIISADTSVLGI